MMAVPVWLLGSAFLLWFLLIRTDPTAELAKQFVLEVARGDLASAKSKTSAKMASELDRTAGALSEGPLEVNGLSASCTATAGDGFTGDLGEVYGFSLQGTSPSEPLEIGWTVPGMSTCDNADVAVYLKSREVVGLVIR